ncbi:probable uridine nucleosidase 1 isoform X4 [Physcomitrium patens]|nr:probable uridine nucleosidase 1 isoform X4 [Physcomitrium patens]|eukprot:XP_024393266.1 probable uridine nucleosidase 1 isoform X4 [Physcomitrella patens]
MMAILMAFQAPEIEVIGLTTIFGNVNTDLATINALHLCEMAGHPEIPVAEGPSEPLKRVKPRIAYFEHGSDGLGETYQAKPNFQKLSKDAADFLIENVTEFPGEVTVVGLGPLTNLALAIQKDSNFAKNVGQLVVLGGSFNASGNVNPAAEANVSLKRQKSHSRNLFGDPEAADIVFTSGMNTLAIGIDLTTQVIFNEDDLCEIRDSGGDYGKYIYDCCRFYHDWHLSSDHLDGIFLHDPTCMAALLDPTLFTFKNGAVRVETEGPCLGHTILGMGLKKYVNIHTLCLAQLPSKLYLLSSSLRCIEEHLLLYQTFISVPSAYQSIYITCSETNQWLCSSKFEIEDAHYRVLNFIAT